MHIISYKMIREFTEKYPESKDSMDNWFRLVKKENFSNYAELKRVFPRADLVKNFIVFDIGRNK